MSTEFEERFRSLTGFQPMEWQARLFGRLVKNEVPKICDIPTGLGKTSVLALWLLALTRQAESGTVRLPRRLIYIVNRRTVVDQATQTAERMRTRLLQPECADCRPYTSTLETIAATLRALCATEGVPLAVSTLRGELADNEEWKADPARPAIVVGTIDMIGSKLLFSGYGDGRYGRAHHAGLIGYDALIVHDEAHLTPAFSDLLAAIGHEQNREALRSGRHNGIARPIHVTELSATSRGREGNPHPADIFTLEPQDEKDPIIHERLTAMKRLHLHQVPEDAVVEKLVELSKADDDRNARVLIYIRSPEAAQRVASTLAKSLKSGGDGRIALLTGTIRGYERDQLVKTNPVYRAFLDPAYGTEKTVYLVSTAAGEVGIDLDADHLVGDLTTLDALIQRLGRVNRRGGQARQARVDVIGRPPTKEKLSDVDKAVVATLTLLRRWEQASKDGIDVSPRNLRRLLSAADPETIRAAFSPRPDAPALTDILLDAWSLTSIQQMPGRPEVAAFLHGLTHDPPETFVAWRKEISLLDQAGVDESSLAEWFRACRIEAQEQLRDQTKRVSQVLAALLQSHRKRQKDDRFDLPVVLLDERGDARWYKLSAIVGKEVALSFRTVVLPVEAGGLDGNGMLDAKAAEPPEGLRLDVCEERASDDHRERWRCYFRSADEHYERLLTGDAFDVPPSALREKERIPLRQPEEGEEDAEAVDLVLLVSREQSALEKQTLAEHTHAIVAHVSAIAQRLSLPARIQGALVTAARWHDKGKDRAVWQRYARNAGGTEFLAKARSYLHPRTLGGYRHEFGSLLDAMNNAALRRFPERELVLHLTAAHHGWARPHFERRSFDSSYTTDANREAFSAVVRRFGRLQHRYGRWGLAWLESLVRCADIAASQQPVASAPAVTDSRVTAPEEARP